jgi:CRP-like cAMP-binding protein
MPRTLLDLKHEAERRLADGRVIDALRVYRLLLEALPLDFNLRLEIGDALARAGADKLACAVWQAVADHDLKSGSPLRAMVAIKLLDAAGLLVEPLIGSLTATYSAGSSKLGRGVRPAPGDYSLEIRDDVDLDYAMDERQVLEDTARMAAFTGNIQNYPAVVPPLAIFSTLEPAAFSRFLKMLRLRRFRPGDAVVRQGEMGNELFFIARGEVRVSRRVEGPGGDAGEAFLARLGPGSLFGEMALISSEPRGASVICEERCDLLQLTRAQVEQAAAEMPHVAGAMARFTRERMISNLLATNPLFAPFDADTRKQLLARFTGHEVPSGTIFLEQGTPGTGLYLILQGRAEVLKWSGGEYAKLAELGPGDVAGEISLLHEEPATATVRTTTAATLLFLARELFQPLIEAVPELLAHFARLAQARLDDTEFKLMRERVLDDDFVESVDDVDEEELAEDDLVLL